MVVQCSKRVRNVKPMMTGVKSGFTLGISNLAWVLRDGLLTVEPFVHVHRPVEEVLPGVDH